MPLAIRFVAGQYMTDASVAIPVKVEADRFADGDFAWTAPAVGTVLRGYGSIKPRKVGGVDPLTGKSRSVIVPDLGANVWTGAATTFTIEDAEGVEVTYTITSHSGELVHLSR